jgi:cytochrome c oxidase subunit 4
MSTVENEKHTVPYRVFIIIWGLLLILTGVTIGVSRINFGYFNVVVALLIATIKAFLVVFFFMHLKYENRFFKFIVFLTFLILAIFIGFTFFDVAYR